MKAIDTLIHIDQSLDSEQQHALEAALRNERGVVAPRFNRDHLLVVAYDGEATSAKALLSAIHDHGYRAQLVGL